MVGPKLLSDRLGRPRMETEPSQAVEQSDLT